MCSIVVSAYSSCFVSNRTPPQSLNTNLVQPVWLYTNSGINIKFHDHFSSSSSINIQCEREGGGERERVSEWLNWQDARESEEKPGKNTEVLLPQHSITSLSQGQKQTYLELSVGGKKREKLKRTEKTSTSNNKKISKIKSLSITGKRPLRQHLDSTRKG